MQFYTFVLAINNIICTMQKSWWMMNTNNSIKVSHLHFVINIYVGYMQYMKCVNVCTIHKL